MASKILGGNVDNESNMKKRKNHESDLEVSDESRKKVKEASQSVTETKVNPPELGVLTSWKEPPILQVPESCSSNIVFFDLETTSLELDCDITQVSAIHDKEIFNTYVVPEKQFHPESSSVTGMTCYGEVLYLHNKPVEAVSKRVAQENFLDWIKARSPVLMFAHNAQFDYQRLFHAVVSQGLLEQYCDHIEGFVDTLPMFRASFPGLPNYRQKTIAEKILKRTYSCHNSLEDVKILQELYLKSQPYPYYNYSCTFTSAYNRWFYYKRARESKSTFSKMVKDGTLTTYSN